jgi:hypothetical protein
VLLVLALACGFEDMVSGFVVQTGFATLPATWKMDGKSINGQWLAQMDAISY